ncbi:MAG TPA: hypothetical protein VHX44_04750 [Planctomycetota bacterium]|nr:hypothetical protein [Planctomycetota bacterium]
MDTTTWLILGVLTGAFGMAYFVYGKKQGLFMPMIAGAALCIYPYFTDSLVITILAGVVLLALPFVFRF